MRVLSVHVSVKRSQRLVWRLTRWNATSMSTPSDSPRVRLQPIYSDRSLEAIQMRNRENAGVINRHRTSACHAVRLTCSLLMDYRLFSARQPRFRLLWDIRLFASVVYSIIMQFVISCVCKTH